MVWGTDGERHGLQVPQRGSGAAGSVTAGRDGVSELRNECRSSASCRGDARAPALAVGPMQATTSPIGGSQRSIVLAHRRIWLQQADGALSGPQRMLAASTGLRVALGPPRPRARLCRKAHVRCGAPLWCRAAGVHRPAAGSRPSPPSATLNAHNSHARRIGRPGSQHACLLPPPVRRRRQRRPQPQPRLFTATCSPAHSHILPCRSGAPRPALRCQASTEGRPHGSADEAALQTLMMKLREDDVEYFELKVGWSCPVHVLLDVCSHDSSWQHGQGSCGASRVATKRGPLPFSTTLLAVVYHALHALCLMSTLPHV